MKIFQRYRISCFIIILICIPHSIHSSIQYTHINQRSLTIGDHIELTVSLVIPKGAQTIPPETDTGFGKFIIKNWSHHRNERKSSDSVSYKYLLSIYEVVSCSIPSLPFIAYTDLRRDTLFSDVIPMEVLSVITADSGDSVRFKDIKPQQVAGSPSLFWLWGLLSILFLIGLIFLLRYLWLRSRKPPPPPPPIPPYDEAVESLANLQRKDLITKGLLREYVFELSDILKRYIERQFECNAAEFTTEEMLEYIQSAPFGSELKKSMEWFFHTTHPVKFAKILPDITTVKQLYDEVILFVQKTIPAPIPEKKTGKREDGKQ